MWAHLFCSAVPVARYTVERLMCHNGWQGVTRQKKVVTTISDTDASLVPDLVKRDVLYFKPDKSHFANFTYVRIPVGFGYTALVIDAFAGADRRLECSLYRETTCVERVIRRTAGYRARQGHPMVGSTMHNSDAVSQYCALRFGETPSLSASFPQSAPLEIP